jgi:hypothetical protein
VEKSSNWTSSRGKTSFIAAMNSSMNSSICNRRSGGLMDREEEKKRLYLGRGRSGATDADVQRIVQVTLRVRTHVQTYRKLRIGENVVEEEEEEEETDRRRRPNASTCNIQVPSQVSVL